MIITCENCSTRFILDDSLVKAEGSRVRCSKCAHIFMAMPEKAVPILDLEPDIPEDMPSPEESSVTEKASAKDANGSTEAFKEVDFDEELDFDPDELDFTPPSLDIPGKTGTEGNEEDSGTEVTGTGESDTPQEEKLEEPVALAPEAPEVPFEDVDFDDDMDFDQADLELDNPFDDSGEDFDSDRDKPTSLELDTPGPELTPEPELEPETDPVPEPLDLSPEESFSLDGDDTPAENGDTKEDDAPAMVDFDDVSDAEPLDFDMDAPAFEAPEDFDVSLEAEDEEGIPMPEPEGETPSDETEETPLDLDVPAPETDLEIEPGDDTSNLDDIEFEDLSQPVGDSAPAAPTEDDMDLSLDFDGEDNLLEVQAIDDDYEADDLEEIPLEMIPDGTDDIDFNDTDDIVFEDITFDEVEDEDLPSMIVSPEMDDDDGLVMLEMEDTPEEAASETSSDEFSDSSLPKPDLELSFDDALGIEDMEFDDEVPDQEEQAEEPPPEFPDAEDVEEELSLDMEMDEDEPAGLNMEDDSIDEPADPDQKFAEFDQVLDQDTEPDEPFPDFDEAEEEDLDGATLQEETTPASISKQSAAQPSPLIEPPSEPPASVRKRHRGGMSTPIKVILLVLILVIAAYLITLRLGINLPFLSDIKIPYVTQAFKPAPPPVTAIGPIPNDPSTKGRFVTNESAGRLFVVTGRIDNPDKTAYSHIRVKGTLITKDGKNALTQVVYCGNVITPQDLKTGNISDINKRLEVKSGIDNANLNVKPGGSVDFMLVFSNLPENLANFTVEIQGYKPAGPQ